MQHLASENKGKIPLNNAWFMAVFIPGDSFTLEHKGKLGSKAL